METYFPNHAFKKIFIKAYDIFYVVEINLVKKNLNTKEKYFTTIFIFCNCIDIFCLNKYYGSKCLFCEM